MHTYDVLIIGSGAGGSAAAWRLATAGLRVLLLERGRSLAGDESTLDPVAVATDPRYVSGEVWEDGDGRRFVPGEHFNLGGKTKWYGAALLRFGPEEFEAEPERGLLPWPIRHAELLPYYELAESLLGVRTFALEPDLAALLKAIDRTDSGWQSAPLPLGLRAAILDHDEELTHFDGFVSPRNLKADGETAFLAAVHHLPNLRILTGQAVERLLADGVDPHRVTGVACSDGRVFRADSVLLAAGALHSPRLLGEYLGRTGLHRSLPSASLIGRYYKSHLKSFLLAFSGRPQTDRLRKTVLLTHPQLPYSSVQTLGWIDGAVLASQLPGWWPRRLLDVLGRHAYGFFLQTEDGSHPDNRVRFREGRRPVLDFRADRLPAELAEHRRLIARFRRALHRAGHLTAVRPVPLAGTAHALGTLVTGTDPSRSVVDADGRVHGLANLYVVDGSALPRSARVNPALTIYAWGLRVADRLAGAVEKPSLTHGLRAAEPEPCNP